MTTGEQREQERRVDDNDESTIIHLPYLEESLDLIVEDSVFEESTPDDPASHDADSQANANNSKLNGAAPAPAVNLPHCSADQPVQQTVQQSTNHSADEATQNETDDMDNIQAQESLSKREQARLQSLKAMLNASNARYQKATKSRRPKFAAGLKIKIISGDHSGEIGVVVDADYIANRALIALPDEEAPCWLGFRSLGHYD